MPLALQSSPSRRSMMAGATSALVYASTAKAASAWVDNSTPSLTDGAKIVYHIAGNGPPLVVVHGGSTTAEAYKPFADLLTGRYRIALIERRNYTVSQSTGSPHTFEQEVGDVVAVMRALGEPCYLFGHSAGALVSLHAARDHQDKLKALALYEPPLSGGGSQDVAILAQLDALISAKRDNEALVFLYSRFVGLSPEVAKAMVTSRGAFLRPLLPGSRDDIEALVSLDTDPKHWASIRLPTLLLSGDQSVLHPLRDSVAELQAALPNAETRTLTGQGHAAYALAPKMLADDVGGFFAAHV